MAQKTIYVKEESLEIFKKAEEIAGDSLSNIIVKALELFVQKKESERIGYEEIIMEVAASRITERGGRADDKTSETSMEDRKKEGYF